MAHEQDAVADGDPEERHEPDERRHIQLAAGQQEREHAAREREREVDEEQEGRPRAPELLVEDDEDEREREHREQRDRPRRVSGALELPAVLDVIEVIALVFSLACSVADSVGKLFSLILLREAFIEIGHLGEPKGLGPHRAFGVWTLGFAR